MPVIINEDGDRESPEVFSGRLCAQAGDMMVDITQDRATVRILDSSGKINCNFEIPNSVYCICSKIMDTFIRCTALHAALGTHQPRGNIYSLQEVHWSDALLHLLVAEN